MVEPREPSWSALPTFGAACTVPPPGVPSSCFGPLICAGPFPGATGTCDQNPNWRPQVLSFCEVTERFPNPALPLGCFPGNPNPACRNCQGFCPPGVPGCVPCTLPGRGLSDLTERNCPEINNPTDPSLHAYGDGSFTTPSVLEAADTAPYFHDNSALTLEDAIAHYASDEFEVSPAGRGFNGQTGSVEIDDVQVAQIAAHLRVLNAAENVSEAQRVLQRAFEADMREDPRVTFADTELEDAVMVLADSHIHPEAVAQFQRARKYLRRAFSATRQAKRREIARAVVTIDEGRGTMLSVTVVPTKPNSAYTAEYLTPSVPAEILEAAGKGSRKR